MFLIGEKNKSALKLAHTRVCASEVQVERIAAQVRAQALSDLALIGKGEEDLFYLLRTWYIWRVQSDGSLKLDPAMMIQCGLRDGDYKLVGQKS